MPRKKKKRGRQDISNYKQTEENDLSRNYLQRGQYVLEAYSQQQADQQNYATNMNYQMPYLSSSFPQVDAEWIECNRTINNTLQPWPVANNNPPLLNLSLPSTLNVNYPYECNYVYQPNMIPGDIYNHINNCSPYSFPPSYCPYQVPPILNHSSYCMSPFYNSPPPLQHINPIPAYPSYNIEPDKNISKVESIEYFQSCLPEKQEIDENVYKTEQGYIVEEPLTDQEKDDT